MLGPLEIEVDGTPVPTPGPMTQALLVRLALDVGVVVSRDALVDALWGDDPPQRATNALQVKVSELRRLIGPDQIVARRPGYLLDVDPASVDAVCARTLITRARTATSTGIDGTSQLYADALALWRGPALASVSESPFALAAAMPWHELRLAAIEERARLDVTAGRLRPLIAELEAAVTEHPFREPLVEVLMLALAADGRQVAALAAYRALRERLVDHLGIDPSPQLQHLERQILVQHPTIVAAPIVPGIGAAVDAATTGPVRLPHPVSSFIRRDDDVIAVEALVARRRLVSITGQGGAGKSRLAIEVARTISPPPDGVWFIALEAVTDVGHVLDALAIGLGVAGPDAATAVRERLRDADLLLVLDNCEHLGDELAVVLDQVLQQAPGVRCLATSQRPLGISGEGRWPLGPMPRPAAAELFIERARDVAPRIDLDDLDLIDELCARLDDLPLAIELAAGRCGVFTVRELVDRLTDRFSLLRDPHSSRAPRHQTLTAIMSWSYDLLFPDSQVALQAISSCAGGVTVGALEAIMSGLGVPRAEVLDLVTHLAERSLIYADRSGSKARYAALEGVRAFAAAQAMSDGRTTAIGSSHASWVVDLGRQVRVGIRGGDQHVWLSVVRSERANIDAALDWMDSNAPIDALNLVGDCYLAWMMVGDSEAGAARALRALATCDDAAPPTAMARAEGCAAQLLARTGAHVEAVALARQAAARIEGGPEIDVVEVNSILGRVLMHAGRLDEGRDLVEAAEVRFAELCDDWGVAMAHLSIGWAEHLLDHPDIADRCVESALESLGTFPDAWVTHAAHRLRGVVAAAAGDDPSAVVHFEAALTGARALGSMTDEGQVLAHLAAARARTGETALAAETYRDAQRASRLAGDHVTLDSAHRELELLVTQGGLANGFDRRSPENDDLVGVPLAGSAHDQRPHSVSSAGSSTVSACRLPSPTSMSQS
jgi:predicted ATPase/DNA-binding SARP family transcriptional activator